MSDIPPKRKYTPRPHNKKRGVFCGIRGHKYFGKRKCIEISLMMCLFCGIPFARKLKCAGCRKKPEEYSGCRDCKKYMYITWEECKICKIVKRGTKSISCGQCGTEYSAEGITHYLEFQAGLRIVE